MYQIDTSPLCLTQRERNWPVDPHVVALQPLHRPQTLTLSRRYLLCQRFQQLRCLLRPRAFMCWCNTKSVQSHAPGYVNPSQLVMMHRHDRYVPKTLQLVYYTCWGAPIQYPGSRSSPDLSKVIHQALGWREGHSGIDSWVISHKHFLPGNGRIVEPSDLLFLF